MKKAISIFAFVLCILTALFTTVIFIFDHLEYNIKILNIRAMSFVPVIILIFAVCACFLAVKHGKSLLIKAFVAALSALTVYVMFILLIFGGIAQNTVVKTVESQSGKYYAEVIDSDQGALGGNTFVDVYGKCIIKTPVLTLQKKPKRIYSGKWGEYKKMQIYWKDDNCLVINSVEYEIK